MENRSLDSFKCHQTIDIDGREYGLFNLQQAQNNGLGDISKLPYSLKVLLENLLRQENGESVKKEDIQAMQKWQENRKISHEVAYHPARVLMQDFTGVPAVVDLASMRQAMSKLGADPAKINPLSPVDLVIDHSVMVDQYGTQKALKGNVDLEFERNLERYQFLKWAQSAFNNFRVVPPGTGICHQVNLEYLAKVVWVDDQNLLYPDTLVGTDSHTTMVNGMAVLGWGVGGIEAEAAMLAQPISMLVPEVVGFKLTGKLTEGTTATDLVLTVVEKLRGLGVVGKFVEFFGNGLNNLPLADRATIANMAPEYGATCGFFPIDNETIRYLKLSGRDDHQVKVVEAYAKAQGMWRDDSLTPSYTETVELDLGTVKASLAGPMRPQDRIELQEASKKFSSVVSEHFKVPADDLEKSFPVENSDYTLGHGSVVIAAITSCTNTSNPSVMIGAGLLAKKAAALGLQVKPWVKTSLAPGSQVVSEYLEKSGLQNELDALGFHVVGYGCTTCIGNSGPLQEQVSKSIHANNIVATSVLSGNRNFEGRISPDVKANYLASPPLVVAYALAGTMQIDIMKDPIGTGTDGKQIFLKDIWPSNTEISTTLESVLTPQLFKERYQNVFEGPEQWQNIETGSGFSFDWSPSSTYVKHPPFFEDMTIQSPTPSDIIGARPLAILGDSVTTDHISPAGAIKPDSPAGTYLTERKIPRHDFNSYGSRRGNHEIMMRGTFANIRIRNEMLPGVEGGMTKVMPSGDQMSIYDAAMTYANQNTPLVVVGGKEYGTGSSRDWAAKGTRLLGVRAVITESFERIHRSNLIGMGVIPLQFTQGQNRNNLHLDGTEVFDITGLDALTPRCEVTCKITRVDGKQEELKLLCRIDTGNELEYYKNEGILQFVMRKLT